MSYFSSFSTENLSVFLKMLILKIIYESEKSKTKKWISFEAVKVQELLDRSWVEVFPPLR